MSNPQISLELMRSHRRDLAAAVTADVAARPRCAVTAAPVAGARHALAGTLHFVRAATHLRTWVQ